MNKKYIEPQSLFTKYKKSLVSNIGLKNKELVGIINYDKLYQKFKENLLSYLYMCSKEFDEVNELIIELKKVSPYQIDIAECSTIQIALNIAVVISYSRNFTNNYGFFYTKDINKILYQNYTKKEIELHKLVLEKRNREFAHSDASVNNIQIFTEGDFLFGINPLRQPLEFENLELLGEMVFKLRKEVQSQINKFNKK
jgi:hypothetical protein